MNPVEQAEAYLGVLVRDVDPDHYVEIRWFTPNGPRQEWHRIGDLGFACADRIVDLGSTFDTYTGALPRTRRGGKKGDVGVGYVAWADLDTAAAVAALRTFLLPPTMIVYSGGVTKEGVRKRHAYWALDEPIEAARIEAAFRQLTDHLGADPGAGGRARIMRPPGTFNYKDGGRAPVELAEVRPERCYAIDEIEEIVGRAPAEPATRANVVALDARRRPDDDSATAYLRPRPPVEYVEIVTGIKVKVDEKISCPAPDHDDPGPSLHVYPDHWRCYGCGRGGGIFEFGALVAGLLGEPNPAPGMQRRVRGRDFLAIRDVLLARYEKAKGVAS